MSGSGSRWHARSPRPRGCCCSTSRSAHSTARSTTVSSWSCATSSTRIGQTAVYVTHDAAEAFALGSRVAVMRAGEILQVASPEQLWAAPADAWVARFIGLANVEELGATSRVTRPEAVDFRADAGGDATVVASHRDGPLVTLRARFDDGREIVSAHSGLAPPTPGTRVAVEIDRGAVIEVPTSIGRSSRPSTTGPLEGRDTARSGRGPPARSSRRRRPRRPRRPTRRRLRARARRPVRGVARRRPKRHSRPAPFVSDRRRRGLPSER